MGKIDFLNPNSDERFLAARIEDLAESAQNGRLRFSHFLNMRQMEIANAAVMGHDCKCDFFGGFDNASRCIMGFFPDYLETDHNLFPIEALTFKFNRNYSLTHRDVLGALMSQKVERNTIGDIICNEGEAYVFLQKDIKDTLITSITTIGKVGVKVLNSVKLDNINEPSTSEYSGVVTTMRLDGIIAVMLKKSRAESNKLIASQKVFVNDKVITDNDIKIFNNDIISIRQFGKFKVITDGNLTAKGKMRFSYLKYI